MKLVIASNNKGKIREYKQILEPLGYEVFSQSEAGLILDVEETGTTFAENSALKARAAFKLCGCAVLADDSGLEIDALDGEPGVGENGFGYDPIFMYGNKSFAQVDSETKNTVSHRANALKALLEQLTKQ